MKGGEGTSGAGAGIARPTAGTQQIAGQRLNTQRINAGTHEASVGREAAGF